MPPHTGRPRARRALLSLARNLVAPLVLAFACPACALMEGPRAEPWRVGVAAMIGDRELDDDADLPGLDEQDVVGITVDAYRPHATLGLEAALVSADAERGPDDVRTLELSLGVRRTWLPDDLGVRGIYPFVGAGVALLSTDSDVGGESSDDFGAGVYAHFGAYGLFADHWRVGFDCRFLREDIVDSGAPDLDAGQLAFTVGYAF